MQALLEILRLLFLVLVRRIFNYSRSLHRYSAGSLQFFLLEFHPLEVVSR